jgi:hypothetical protein
MIKLKNLLRETSVSSPGMSGKKHGLVPGDSWPDGIFVRYGQRRIMGPGGMPRGMKQVVAPASDSIYGGDGSKRDKTDMERDGVLKRTKITPALVKSNAVIDPHKDLRSDEPPLSPEQRLYGRRAFGKSPQYTIPRETADGVFTGGPDEEDILVRPTTPPEGSLPGMTDIPPTPEPGSKALGSPTGYRQVQKGGESVVRDVDKMYIYKMLGQYDPKKEGLKEGITREQVLGLIKLLKREGSLPTKVKQVLSKKLKKALPDPNSKRAKQFVAHHKVHSGPHITGQGAEHATYDFDDDWYTTKGGIQRRKKKDKQKRGYEPVENYSFVTLKNMIL